METYEYVYSLVKDWYSEYGVAPRSRKKVIKERIRNYVNRLPLQVISEIYQIPVSPPITYSHFESDVEEFLVLISKKLR